MQGEQEVLPYFSSGSLAIVGNMNSSDSILPNLSSFAFVRSVFHLKTSKFFTKRQRRKGRAHLGVASFSVSWWALGGASDDAIVRESRPFLCAA